MTAMLSTMKKLLSNSTTTTNPSSGNSTTTSPNVSGSVNNGSGSGGGGLGNQGNLDPNKPQHSDAGLSDKDKQALSAWAVAEFGKMKSARQTVQRKWYMNLAMYYGRQYLDVLPSAMGGTLGVPKSPRHRVRATVNLVRPMIRTEISRMTSQKPSARRRRPRLARSRNQCSPPSISVTGARSSPKCSSCSSASPRTALRPRLPRWA